MVLFPLKLQDIIYGRSLDCIFTIYYFSHSLSSRWIKNYHCSKKKQKKKNTALSTDFSNLDDKWFWYELLMLILTILLLTFLSKIIFPLWKYLPQGNLAFYSESAILRQLNFSHSTKLEFAWVEYLFLSFLDALKKPAHKRFGLG